jgi:uncharacterized membrane protein YfcA
VGVYSGLFGVGGAVLMVPALVFWFAYGEHRAAATALAANFLVAATGAVIAGIHGSVDVSAALVAGVPGAGAAVAGARLQRRVSQAFLAGVLALVFIGIGATLVL